MDVAQSHVTLLTAPRTSPSALLPWGYRALLGLSSSAAQLPRAVVPPSQLEENVGDIALELHSRTFGLSPFVPRRSRLVRLSRL
jgi:hypothetical protein